MRHQSIFEDRTVVLYTRCIRPAPPAKVSRFDAQSNLVTNATLFELVKPEFLIMTHCQAKIGTINQKQTVVSNVTFLPVVKYNLSEGAKKCLQPPLSNQQQQQQVFNHSTYHCVI